MSGILMKFSTSEVTKIPKFKKRSNVNATYEKTPICFKLFCYWRCKRQFKMKSSLRKNHYTVKTIVLPNTCAREKPIYYRGFKHAIYLGSWAKKCHTKVCE